MAKLLLADSFAPRYKRLKVSLPQGTLLHGEPGIGLGILARDLGGQHARILQPTTKQGEIDLANGTITVESIRELYQQTRGKTSEAQIVIIESADRMSLSAQNAFLKLLEEPSLSVRFILTSHDNDNLLPTIMSRVQAFHVPRLSPDQSRRLLSQYDLTESAVRQIEFLANGRPGLINDLATDEKLRLDAASAMSDAREFLQLPGSYRALVIANKYSTDRQQAIHFVDALMNVLKHSLYNAPQINQLSKAEQIGRVRLNLEINANHRLQLLRLVLL